MNLLILLIDEILAVGDQHFQEKCFTKLKELRDTDRTIVIVSHSLNTIKDLCTRAIWLYKGEFRLDGDPVYVINEYLKQQREAYKKGEISANELEIPTKSVIFIEKPRGFEILKKDETLQIKGWKVSDLDNAVFKVYLDNQLINEINYSVRNDVYETYKSECQDLIADDIGWFVNINDISSGEHHIKAILEDSLGIEIAKKEVNFSKE